MVESQWVVKYQPKSSKDLIGNNSNYTKLFTWLKSYYKLDKTDKKFKPIYLLIGPPGIGKTSGILAIANDLNFEIVEFNASDQRNAGAITRLVGRASRTKKNPGYAGRIVLLDEVDGVHGNEDRGGLSSILKVAKESYHPIICTANDPNSTKMRSFKKSVSVNTLSFKIPTTDDVVKLLQKIATKEQIKVPEKLLKVIATNARGDIRGSVNDLENLAQDRKEIPINAIQALSIRDSEVSVDDALNQVFGAKTLRQAHEVTSDLDIDLSMFGHYVTENIAQHSKSSRELKNMYEYSAISDLFNARVFSSQNYKYWKYMYYFLSAGIRANKTSPYVKKYPRFPSFLMELSRTKKIRNIRSSVATKIGRLSHSSSFKTNYDTLPFLRIQFENLYDEYIKTKAESERGEKLLSSIAEIHNKVNLEPDEFLFLFNNPLYEKPTAATEKKQKQIIKLIEKKAEELRLLHSETHNIQINKNRPATFLDSVSIPETNDAPVSEKTKEKLKKSSSKKKKEVSASHKTDEKDTSEVTPKRKRTKKKTSDLLSFTDDKSSKSSKKVKKKKSVGNLKDFI